LSFAKEGNKVTETGRQNRAVAPPGAEVAGYVDRLTGACLVAKQGQGKVVISMELITKRPVDIALRTLKDEERRRVHAWFDPRRIGMTILKFGRCHTCFLTKMFMS
jgi:hypothetical protein